MASLIKRISVIIVLFGGFGANGHHDPFGDMDLYNPVAIEGQLVGIEWISPHVVLHIETRNESGETTEWAIQGSHPNRLLRTGVSRRTLQTGRTVTVELFESLGTSCTNTCSGYGLRLIEQSGQRYIINAEVDARVSELQINP